jgi:tetratricopeptide (TPR) repeat protein
VLGALLALAAPALAREWYEAYQEGVRALARGQHQQALFLLEEAIQQNPRPGVNVRTYGTNVERTYHPYLRLAEAHLGLGSLEGARAALQRSESLGVEPAEERSRLRARLEQLSERQRPQPPPTTAPAAAAPTTLPPTPPPATPHTAQRDERTQRDSDRGRSPAHDARAAPDDTRGIAAAEAGAGACSR